MASYTTNLNLKKPAGSENVAIGDINNNMDTIDQAFGTLVNISSTTADTESVPTGSFKTLATFSPTVKGNYILVVSCAFGNDTNGIRILLVDTTETSSNTPTNSVLASGRASIEKTRIIGLNTTDTVYIRAYQNSGSSITCAYAYRWIRVGG